MQLGENGKNLIIKDADDVRLTAEALLSTTDFTDSDMIRRIQSFPFEVNERVSTLALWSLRDVVKHSRDPSFSIDVAVMLEKAGIEYSRDHLNPLYQQVVAKRLNI